MHISPVLFVSVCLLSGAAAQQTPSAASKPSAMVQPAVDKVAQAGSAVDLNRWKGPASVRNEIDGYLLSMRNDLLGTLPSLCTAADAAPESTAASLPLLLNLDALYSVLLRITVAAHSYAPREQSAALDQSATLLDSARRDLGDALLASAHANEKRIAELQANLQQQAAAFAAAANATAAPTTPAKRTKASKSRPSSSSN